MIRIIMSLYLIICANNSNADTYDFEVRLNDKAIGHHKITVKETAPGSTLVAGSAEYTLKILGVVVFSYRHQHDELWQGDCLKSLQSVTETNGKTTNIALALDQDKLMLSKNNASSVPVPDAPDCLWSYAYWAPNLRNQTTLVNGQTGALTDVAISPVAPLNDSAPNAQRFELVAPEQHIFVDYDALGRWNGLEVPLAKNRVLTYHLR